MQYIENQDGSIAVDATSDYFENPILIIPDTPSNVYNGPRFILLFKNQWEDMCASAKVMQLNENNEVKSMYLFIRNCQKLFDESFGLYPSQNVSFRKIYSTKVRSLYSTASRL